MLCNFTNKRKLRQLTIHLYSSSLNDAKEIIQAIKSKIKQ